jgi:predicted transcriptional regulator
MILPLCDHAVMDTNRFDALNALKVRWESSSQEWSRVEDVADDLGESMSAIERVLDPCLHEGLVEQRGTDQDPEYKLTRSGDMYVTDGS